MPYWSPAVGSEAAGESQKAAWAPSTQSCQGVRLSKGNCTHPQLLCVLRVWDVWGGDCSASIGNQLCFFFRSALDREPPQGKLKTSPGHPSCRTQGTQQSLGSRCDRTWGPIPWSRITQLLFLQNSPWSRRAALAGGRQHNKALMATGKHTHPSTPDETKANSFYSHTHARLIPARRPFEDPAPTSASRGGDGFLWTEHHRELRIIPWLPRPVRRG